MKKLRNCGLLRLATVLVVLTIQQLQLSAQSVSLSLQPGTCGKDALVSSCVPCLQNTMNYGSAPEFNAMAWTNGSAIANQRSLIHFDLSAIPTGSVVTSAAISLYFDPNSSNGQHSALSGPNDAYLQQITADWDENIVTWNNQPATTTTNAVYLPPSTTATQDYLNVNATAMIQAFVNNPASNYGMMLKMATETQYRRLIFASSDHANPALRPRLVVNYTPSAQAPLQITPAGSTAICPGASVVLNANSMAGATYQWYKDGVAVSGATNTSYTASSAGSYTVTAAVGCGLVHTSAAQQVVTQGYICAVPQNVNLTNITSTTAKVNWSNASAPQMQVRYRKQGTNGYTVKSFASTACNTSYTITGLKKNTTYLVSVRTNCSTGASAYSPEVTLTTSNARFAEETTATCEVTMYPSPAINLLNLNISVNEYQSGVLNIFDLTGREVLNQTLICSPGENSFSIDISQLKAGNYMVIAEGVEISFRQIMIKQ